LRVGLYLHFPYCRSRCTYCDFNAYTVPEQSVQDQYLEGLIRDIEATGRERNYRIRTVFLGGGTPSLYSAPDIARVMDACRSAFHFEADAEVTIEANPGTVSPESLRGYLSAGVNRISLGVQTFDSPLLRVLNRVHSPDEVHEAVRWSRAAGFKRLSLDLIYGLPGQTVAGWVYSLEQALQLEPQHLSIYQLMVEPGTHLEAQLRNAEVTLPDEEVSDAMDIDSRPRLRKAGFRRYEVSNWTRPGEESRHNQVYWRDQPYLGLGCGATGFIGGWRIRRILHPQIYARALSQGRSPVAVAERMGDEAALKDCLMMGLRTRQGVPFRRLQRRFPTLDLQRLRSYCDELPPEWFRWEPQGLKLTSRGVDFATSVQLQLMDFKIL
jgi:oxygen-independent coproporphyrinogen-3 oxidase